MYYQPIPLDDTRIVFPEELRLLKEELTKTAGRISTGSAAFCSACGVFPKREIIRIHNTQFHHFIAHYA